MIVLHELAADASLGEASPAVGLSEEAARVAKAPGANEKNFGQLLRHDFEHSPTPPPYRPGERGAFHELRGAAHRRHHPSRPASCAARKRKPRRTCCNRGRSWRASSPAS